MQLKKGYIFQDPKTDFTWKIDHPWVSRWSKRQLGWICKRAGFNPLQLPVSNWYEQDIINTVPHGRIATTTNENYTLLTPDLETSDFYFPRS